ncbi:MAG: hypothetical protein Q4C42_07315 [Clostridia bacterium]|nr:hypothetical protein [Clostridia bacterium]
MSSRKPSGEAGFLNKRQLKIAKTVGSGKDQSRTIYFNNGEPIGTAFKKIVAQLLFVIIVLGVIIGIAWAKMYVTDIFSNDSIFTLTMSSKYADTAYVNDISTFVADGNSGAGAINAVATSMGNAGISSSVTTDYYHMMEKALSDSFGENNVVCRKNLSNFNMMTEIYDALSENKSVICQMTLDRDAYAENASDIVYVVVTSVNYSRNEILVQTPYGDTRTLTGDEFVSATRFENKKNYTLGEKLATIFGFKVKNTVFFIER